LYFEAGRRIITSYEYKIDRSNSVSTFRVGHCVRVTRLKRLGEIVEVLPNNRYRVSIGSLSMFCSGSELTESNEKGAAPKSEKPVQLPRVASAPATVDLHGLTVDEALRKLESWLNQAILADLWKLKVIHGLGTGKVQRAVHTYLAGVRAVKNFKINDVNPGETDVFL
jgi:DNA mismatch repair protein MutS2